MGFTQQSSQDARVAAPAGNRSASHNNTTSHTTTSAQPRTVTTAYDYSSLPLHNNDATSAPSPADGTSGLRRGYTARSSSRAASTYDTGGHGGVSTPNGAPQQLTTAGDVPTAAKQPQAVAQVTPVSGVATSSNNGTHSPHVSAEHTRHNNARHTLGSANERNDTATAPGTAPHPPEDVLDTFPSRPTGSSRTPPRWTRLEPPASPRPTVGQQYSSSPSDRGARSSAGAHTPDRQASGASSPRAPPDGPLPQGQHTRERRNSITGPFDASLEYDLNGILLFWKPPSAFSFWTPSEFTHASSNASWPPRPDYSTTITRCKKS